MNKQLIILAFSSAFVLACGGHDGDPPTPDAGGHMEDVDGGPVVGADAGTRDGGAPSSDAGADAGGDSSPLVYLNHGYVVLPEAVFTTIQDNTYLASEFVDVEIRTTVRPDFTYTGTYLNMEGTYYEFFGHETFAAPVGLTAFAVGVERPGDLERLVTDWRAALGDEMVPDIELISRTIDDTTVPWFRMAYPEVFNYDHTDLWVMEYVPSAPGATAPGTRAEERAARYDSSKLARDIATQLVAFPEEDSMMLQRVLVASGWDVSVDGDVYRARSPLDHGTRRQIILVPNAEGRFGLLGLRIELNRMATHTEALSDDVLLEVGVGGEPIANLWLVHPTASDRALLNSSPE